MVESSQALILHERKSVNSTDYVELLKWEAEPNKKYYIRDINIAFDAVTRSPIVTVSINGEKKLRDFQSTQTTFSLSFGGDLVFRGAEKKPTIWVQIKNDAGGATITTVTVTGIQEDYDAPVENSPPVEQGIDN